MAAVVQSGYAWTSSEPASADGARRFFFFQINSAPPAAAAPAAAFAAVFGRLASTAGTAAFAFCFASDLTPSQVSQPRTAFRLLTTLMFLLLCLCGGALL